MSEARTSIRLAKKRNEMKTKGIESPWKTLMPTGDSNPVSDVDEEYNVAQESKRKRRRMIPKKEKDISEDEIECNIELDIFSNITATLSSEVALLLLNGEFERFQQQIREETGADILAQQDQVILTGSYVALQEAKPIIEKEVRNRKEKLNTAEEVAAVQVTDSKANVDPDLIRVLQDIDQSDADKSANDQPDLEQTTIVDNDKVLIKRKSSRLSADNTAHKCPHCEYHSSKQGIAKHIARHHTSAGNHCPVCAFKFTYSYDLRRHLLLHFDSNGNLNDKGRALFAKINKDVDLNKTLPTLTSIEIENEYKDTFVVEYNGIQVISNKEEDGRESSNPIPYSKDQFLFGCSDCTHQETFTGLLRHMASAHWQFTCSQCSNGFDNETKFLKHFSSGKNKACKKKKDGAIVSCMKCSFKGVKKLMGDHFTDSHGIALRCLLCESEFDSEDIGLKHYASEHAGRLHLVTPGLEKLRLCSRQKPSNKTFTCLICNKTLNVSRRRLHMQNHDSSRVTCQECNIQFQFPYQLNQHLRTKHGGSQYQCNICGKCFTAKTSLQFHLENAHQNNMYRCEECSREFSHIRFLKVHINRVHKQEKKYFCPTCNRGFYENVRMKDHMLTHIDGPAKEAMKKFECEYCHKRFLKMAQLQQHLNMHTGEKPYSCKICNARFTWASDVYRHMGHHSEEKPFVCGQCGKAFKFRYKLASHMAIHLRKGKHKCNFCQQEFPSGTQYSQHRCMYMNSNMNEVGVLEVNKSGMIVCAVEPDKHVEVVADSASGQERITAIEEEEGTEVSFMCAICQLFFGSSQAIDEHFEVNHPDVSMVVREENPQFIQQDEANITGSSYSILRKDLIDENKDISVLIVPDKEEEMENSDITQLEEQIVEESVIQFDPKNVNMYDSTIETETCIVEVQGIDQMQSAEIVEQPSSEMKEIAVALTDLAH